MDRTHWILLLWAFSPVAGCGPGRQATWEKQPVIEQTKPVPPPVVEPAEQPDLEQLAAAAWQERDQRPRVEAAIDHWEALIANAPERTELLTRLSRAYFFLADAHLRGAGDLEERDTALEKGISAGERAMMASSEDFAQRVRAGERVEDAVTSIPVTGQAAIYWYASNLGVFAAARGMSTSLFYKDRLEALMQRALSLDESFLFAAPHRFLGAYYAQAPAFAGGDLERAKTHLDRALELAGDYLGTRVVYAEYYATKRRDRKLFVELLEGVLAADPEVLPDVAPEQRVEQDKARELLARVDEYF